MTLARVWRALSLWEKIKLSTSLLWTGLSLLDSDEMKKEIERLKVGWGVGECLLCGCDWGVGARDCVGLHGVPGDCVGECLLCGCGWRVGGRDCLSLHGAPGDNCELF